MKVIRPFRQQDKTAIFEISKHTWRGYDQLPSELDRLFVDTNSYLYVLEYKGRVVAFANLNVIDDGKTGWMEHMRVHWRYRKQGFAWAMTKWLISKAEALGVKRIRLTSTAENEATRRITQHVGMHQVLATKLFMKGKFRGVRWKDVSVPTTPCTPSETFRFLNTQPDLVPESIIIHYWHAFDLTKPMIESLGKSVHFWKGERNGRVVSLSFGYLRPFHDEFLWSSTIYALDESSFFSALSQQLQAAKKQGAGEFLCFHHTKFQAANIIPGLKTQVFESQLLLYEKQRPFAVPDYDSSDS